jgi:hypothetical protein
MPEPDSDLDAWITAVTPLFVTLRAEDQERLRGIARAQAEQGLPEAMAAEALRSTAMVLHELAGTPVEQAPPPPAGWSEETRRFAAANAPRRPLTATEAPVRERKREERERLHQYLLTLLQEARRARGRHEVKKSRNLLLKVDQREVRRSLGRDGDELCRQINTWLRATASHF